MRCQERRLSGEAQTGLLVPPVACGLCAEETRALPDAGSRPGPLKGPESAPSMRDRGGRHEGTKPLFLGADHRRRPVIAATLVAIGAIRRAARAALRLGIRRRFALLAGGARRLLLAPLPGAVALADLAVRVVPVPERNEQLMNSNAGHHFTRCSAGTAAPPDHSSRKLTFLSI